MAANAASSAGRGHRHVSFGLALAANELETTVSYLKSLTASHDPILLLSGGALE